MSAYDIYEKKEFEQALARLIANNLDVNVWIFKIDDEFGGRGHASLDVEQVRTVVELRRKNGSSSGLGQKNSINQTTGQLGKNDSCERSHVQLDLGKVRNIEPVVAAVVVVKCRPR